MRTATRVLRGKRPRTRRGIKSCRARYDSRSSDREMKLLRGADTTVEEVRLKVNPFTLHNPLVIVEGSKV